MKRQLAPAAAIAFSIPLLLGLALGCKKPEPAPAPAPAPPAAAPQPAGIQVSEVQLGNAIGADRRVVAALDTFAPTDTIYASVVTTGSAPRATLTARFTFEDGQVVNESSQELGGAGVTEFHISKPDGWPAGAYTLEVLLDGTSAATRSFRVAG
jgi:hypothetical protein